MQRENFYKKIVSKFIKDRNARILVIGGDILDSTVFKQLRFKNVTISNLDKRIYAEKYLPYKWSFQNAELLSFNDEEFDYVLVHAALHHCYSPHKALTEMYRVAKYGVLGIESRDSFLMRLAVKLRMTYQYELPAVYFNKFKYGGVANTEIPNYIFRWTEREIEKTINCFAPYSLPKFFYFYDYGNPPIPSSSIFKRFISQVIGFIFKIVFPKQLNLFAFYIQKPNLRINTFPWLIYKNKKIKLNKKWLMKNWNVQY